MPAQNEVVRGVHRLGTSLVNWHVLAEAEHVTVVDAGLPGHRRQLEAFLDRLGIPLRRVEAVVLTHPHGDHIGVAEWLRTEAGARVLVHERDEQLALSGKEPKRERPMLPYLRHPMALRMMWEFGRAGGLRPPLIGAVETFADGAELDVPGRPHAVHTPGHTEGHCVFHLADRGVVFTGDALCSLNPLTGRRGPQIMPAAFNHSSAEALESLARIEALDAGTVLFGHGEPWTDGPAAAVARARELGSS
jgi:glyoxylase-like metal-dependent hydrolase (beta-lactamase superfamily II)